MKSLAIYFSFLLLFALSSCLKDECQEKTVQSEQAEILAFAAAEGITATAHSSGLYYQVINPGTGATPTLSSQVKVTYTGKLLNGTVFETVTTPTDLLRMSDFILGWQIGLQQIQKGGVIKLIIPSSLAYGCDAVGTIPAHSILYFEIALVDVL